MKGFSHVPVPTEHVVNSHRQAGWTVLHGTVGICRMNRCKIPKRRASDCLGTLKQRYT